MRKRAYTQAVQTIFDTIELYRYSSLSVTDSLTNVLLSAGGYGPKPIDISLLKLDIPDNAFKAFIEIASEPSSFEGQIREWIDLEKQRDEHETVATALVEVMNEESGRGANARAILIPFITGERDDLLDARDLFHYSDQEDRVTLLALFDGWRDLGKPRALDNWYEENYCVESDDFDDDDSDLST